MANTLDIIIAVILVIGIVRGFMGGIVKQIGSIAGMIIALVVARLFAPTIVEPIFRSLLNIPEAIYTPLSYLVTFLLVMWAVQLVAMLLHKLLDAVMLGIVNRIAGAAFALFKYALIVSVLLNIALVLDANGGLLSKKTRKESMLYPVVQPIAPALLSIIEASVGEEIEYIKGKNNVTVQQIDVPLVKNNVGDNA